MEKEAQGNRYIIVLIGSKYAHYICAYVLYHINIGYADDIIGDGKAVAINQLTSMPGSKPT